MYSNKQQGLTFIGLVFVLGLIGMIVLSALKVFPVYMEYFSVQRSIETLANDTEIKNMSVKKIRTLLAKKFNMNAVTSVNSGDAEIRKSGGEIVFNLDYEVRKEYIGNVDIVLSFSDEFKIDSNGR